MTQFGQSDCRSISFVGDEPCLPDGLGGSYAGRRLQIWGGYPKESQTGIFCESTVPFDIVNQEPSGVVLVGCRLDDLVNQQSS